MILKAIRFRRTKDSNWESGITFETEGSAHHLIIDSEGNIIRISLEYYEMIEVQDDFTTLTIDLGILLKAHQSIN